MKRLFLTLLAFVLLAGTACKKTFDDPNRATIDLMKEMLACVEEEPEDCDEAINKIIACSKERRADLAAAGRQSVKLVREMSPDELEEYREGVETELVEVMDEYVEVIQEFAEACPQFKRNATRMTVQYGRQKKAFEKSIENE